MSVFRVVLLCAVPILVLGYTVVILETERHRLDRENQSRKAEELGRINQDARALRRELRQRDSVADAKARNALPRRSIK